MKSKRSLFFYGLMVLLAVQPVHGASIASGIEILSTTESSLTVAFAPQEWQSSSQVIDSGTYQRIAFLGAEIAGQPGEPQIPMLTLVVGIPINGTVQYRVLQSDFSQEAGLILPTPSVRRNETAVSYNYQPEASIYQQQEPWPAELVQMESPDYFRDQRVARLHFYPLQFLPADGMVRKYSRIVVQLQFSGASGHPRMRPELDQQIESQYQHLLLNYDQAKSWRKSYSTALAKRGTGFDSQVLYKIRINKEGIYKVTGKNLTDNGISLSNVNPQHIKIYNNGGLELPQGLQDSRPGGPVEIATWVSDGGDGKLDAADFILFYGRPLEGWRYSAVDQTYNHYIHRFESSNVYYLTLGSQSGQRIQRIPAQPGTGLTPEAYYTENLFIEEEVANPLASGMTWLGKVFDNIRLEQVYTASLSQVVPSVATQVKLRVATLGVAFHRFTAFINNYNIGSISASGSQDDLSFRSLQATVPNILKDGSNEIKISYNPSTNVVRAYTDWIEVSYARKFVAEKDLLMFNGPAKSGLALFQLTGFTNNDIRVFDVSQYHRVREITGINISSGAATFADSANAAVPRRYIAVAGANFSPIAAIEKETISDIRTPQEAEFLIITHSDFWNQAMQLKDLHENQRQKDRLKTQVINVRDIYAEFSCGLMDVTAIRDFIKYVFENWTAQGTPILKYVLFLGDGDYDYKNYISNADKNWLPPYQTNEPYLLSSRTTDDWFCSVAGSGRFVDVAVGRLPVQTPTQASNVVEKLLKYELNPNMGDWRTITTLLADDQYGEGSIDSETMHTKQTEDLSRLYVPKTFEQKKIYLVNYESVSSAEYSRPIKPKANRDLLEALNAGTLLFNYIGHGNPRLLAHERVLNEPVDFDRIQNDDRLAVWIAATCDFGLWDSPLEQSFSENIINVKQRGAIGVIASTRLAFSHDNAAFNNKVYEFLFKNYESKRISATLGDAVALAKNSRAGSINDQKYCLIGVPTMRLAAPQVKIQIDSVEPDTIMALRKLTIKGKILKDNQVWNDYQGKVLVRVSDSERDREYEYIANSGGTYKINFTMPGNTVFRGFSTIQNGLFETKLIVPKDITYGGTRGRISGYAWNDQYIDGVGYTDGLSVGGTATGLNDTEGPQIKIGFAGQEFSDGGYVAPDTELKVEIADSLTGVNIAGAIGHQIEMIIDNDSQNKHDLTPYFRYFEGSYYSGEIHYAIPDLQPGEHTLLIKAWDNANNAATAEARFVLLSSADYGIENLLNYPNPMRDFTQFTFDLIAPEAEVSLKIFTVAGRLVRSFESYRTNQIGFNVFPGTWDGTDQDGDPLANGLYLYRIVAKANINGKNHKAEAIGKLVIAR